ncbi:hypothetical protein ACLOJK_024017 [Asimina triloba]
MAVSAAAAAFVRARARYVVMEEKVPKIAFVVLVLAAAAAIAGIRSAGAMTICNMDVGDLEECKDAVTGTYPPAPTPNCCNALSTGDLTCLCNYKGRLKSFGIDPKRAMALPAKCGITSSPKC